MKFWMRIAAPFMAVIAITTSAQAQQWGTGMYGGMQACSYPYAQGAGASSVSDDVREIDSQIKEAQRQLATKKTEKRRADRDADRAREDIEENLSGTYTDFIFEHIENSRRCDEYQGISATYGSTNIMSVFSQSRMPADEGGTVPEDGGEDFIAGGNQGGAPVQFGGTFPIRPFDASEWGQYCQSGGVSGAICNNGRYRSEDGRSNSSICQKGLKEYKGAYARSSKLQSEIDSLERLIERARDDRSDAVQDAADRRRDELEAGVCIDCMSQGSGYAYQKPETDWGSVIGNVGLGLAATYMGYQQNKMVANYNASIGWPTQAYPSWGYGFPYIATGLGQALGGGSGIYGAMNGGIGQGGFACSGNNGGPYGMMGPMGGMNGNGMWGNPYGMAGMGMGGGMYMPGMGPWGMAGPYGNGGPFGGGGMGYPMSGGMGMGMPMMGMNIGGGMAVGGGFAMGGMGMGMPMMGMPMMGMNIGGGMAVGGGFAMGGMGMGMPMMGMPMMGMPMMGMNIGGGMAVGGGFAMGGMGMGMPMGGTDMQMQMMQMQMQQYQQYVQQQQSYMQQQMQRQQVVASLQQELYGLLYRIQTVQYGGGTSYLGGGGGSLGFSSGSTGYSNGVLTPLGTSGTIPIGSDSSTAPIPSTR